MDRLWTPWRLAYVTEASTLDAGLHLLRRAGATRRPSRSSSIAARRAFVILNKFPYNNGHLMVVPHRHVGRLADLDARRARASS